MNYKDDSKDLKTFLFKLRQKVGKGGERESKFKKKTDVFSRKSKTNKLPIYMPSDTQWLCFKFTVPISFSIITKIKFTKTRT